MGCPQPSLAHWRRVPIRPWCLIRPSLAVPQWPLAVLLALLLALCPSVWLLPPW